MNRSTPFARAVPFLAFVAIAIFLALGLTKDPSKLPSNMIDRALPNFELTELKNPDALISQKDFAGRVTLLNVFGSWCVGCLIEHPILMDLSEDHSFDLVGVNWKDTRNDAMQWLARHGDPYDRILFDPDSTLAIELGVVAAPETFIISPDGRIRYKHSGVITDADFNDKILPLIIELVSEAAQ